MARSVVINTTEAELDAVEKIEAAHYAVACLDGPAAYSDSPVYQATRRARLAAYTYLTGSRSMAAKLEDLELDNNSGIRWNLSQNLGVKLVTDAGEYHYGRPVNAAAAR